MSKTKSNAYFQISVRMRPLLSSIEDQEIWTIDSEANTITSKSKKSLSSQLNQPNDQNSSYLKRRYADINYSYQFKYGIFFLNINIIYK